MAGSYERNAEQCRKIDEIIRDPNLDLEERKKRCIRELCGICYSHETNRLHSDWKSILKNKEIDENKFGDSFNTVILRIMDQYYESIEDKYIREKKPPISWYNLLKVCVNNHLATVLKREGKIISYDTMIEQTDDGYGMQFESEETDELHRIEKLETEISILKNFFKFHEKVKLDNKFQKTLIKRMHYTNILIKLCKDTKINLKGIISDEKSIIEEGDPVFIEYLLVEEAKTLDELQNISGKTNREVYGNSYNNYTEERLDSEVEFKVEIKAYERYLDKVHDMKKSDSQISRANKEYIQEYIKRCTEYSQIEELKEYAQLIINQYQKFQKHISGK